MTRFPTRAVLTRVMLCAGLTAALAGCPPTYPKCKTDEDCKDHGEVCVQGECKECATDTNCKAGFVCDANKCVPKPECKDDGACGKNKKCHSGKCVEDTSKSPGTCSVNEDCGSGEECKAGKCAAKGSATASCSMAPTEPGSPWGPIRFDFNEHKLSEPARAGLVALADCIKAQSSKLILEGHADERGTEEFNLQLSNRRAAAVKRYLMDLGVKDSDIETVGYGENRPAVQGAGEDSWATNRRVEIRKR